MRITAVHAVAARNRRSASELARIVGRGKKISESAHGLDYVNAKFFADAPDKDLDGVRIAVEILIVKMLDQLGARDHAASMVHQIGEQAVFVARKFDRIAVDANASVARIQS